MEKIYLLTKFCAAVFKRNTVLLLFVLFFPVLVCCQTTNIFGVVNTYHKVLEIIPAKACIRVADPTGLIVNTRVMLVQMKGATIDINNTSNFGNITAMNEAGNYEIGTICYIIGDSVFLFHTLLNTYSPSSGKVQLVQFGEYYSADVVDTVKAAPWDSVAGTGGVIAIFANQDITLTKPIWADSDGYSGGSYLLSSPTCGNAFPSSNYAYNATSTSPQNGAYKGEGIATLATSQTGGRGALANGGGGGNNHNNSGGGGANLAAGGIGGGNSSSLGCTTTLRGLGGKALGSWSGTKIFSGGGGGAGHSNNGFSSVHGGNGGGIVFLWANNLIGNNELISANGGNGGNSQSDGAGGGGAGGTIIMHISNYIDNATIRANGGNGGNSADGGTIGRCYGGGGGGSGGAVYFTGTIPAITVISNGGLAGVESGRDWTCDPEQAAGAGSNGQTFSNYTFSRSTNPAGYCRYLLPVKLVTFNASAIDKKVLLEWQIDNPETVKRFIIERSLVANQWMELKTLPGNDQNRNYTTADENPVPGRMYYRIKFVEKNNTLSYSTVRQVVTGNTNEFLIYPNPARDKIMIAGNINGPAVIKLLDVSGKIILQKNIINTPAEINLPNLSSGMYLIRINQSVQKLVIR